MCLFYTRPVVLTVWISTAVPMSIGWAALEPDAMWKSRKAKRRQASMRDDLIHRRQAIDAIKRKGERRDRNALNYQGNQANQPARTGWAGGSGRSTAWLVVDA